MAWVDGNQYIKEGIGKLKMLLKFFYKIYHQILYYDDINFITALFLEGRAHFFVLPNPQIRFTHPCARCLNFAAIYI